MSIVTRKAGPFLAFAVLLGAMIAVADDEGPKTDWVAPDAEAVQPLGAGDAVPEVAVRAPDGEAKALREIVRAKPTVLVFYRGGWCMYCTMQLGQLRDAHEQFEALGYQMLGLSMDAPEKLAEGTEKLQLPYALYSDASAAAAKAFGLAFQLDQAGVDRLAGFGIDIEDASGESHRILPVPAVYVIAADGEIQFSHVDPDYRERPAVEALLEAAREARDA